ncbi:hypothetical protein AAG593_13380 [Citromicrobium bathyomarinum]
MSEQAIYRLERGIGSVGTLNAVMTALEFRLTGIGPGRTLAELLRARRLQRGIALDALAVRTGLIRKTISNIEKGGGSIASLMRLMEALAPKAKRWAPQRAYWGQGDKEDRDSRFTPYDFMENIYAAFGTVDIDPCAHRLSPVVAKRRILQDEGGDGLIDDWSGRPAFANPPFSAQLKWL